MKIFLSSKSVTLQHYKTRGQVFSNVEENGVEHAHMKETNWINLGYRLYWNDYNPEGRNIIILISRYIIKNTE